MTSVAACNKGPPVQDGEGASEASGEERAPAAMQQSRVPGLSALSVADRVVAEYERLLEAMPVMARHMGRLQIDTEAMADGQYNVCCSWTAFHP